MGVGMLRSVGLLLIDAMIPGLSQSKTSQPCHMFSSIAVTAEQQQEWGGGGRMLKGGGVARQNKIQVKTIISHGLHFPPLFP